MGEKIKPLSELETVTLRQVFNIMSSYDADKMRGVEENPSLSWRSLGFDSLNIIEITELVEDAFGLEMIDDKILGNIETLGDVVSAILITPPKKT